MSVFVDGSYPFPSEECFFRSRRVKVLEVAEIKIHKLVGLKSPGAGKPRRSSAHFFVRVIASEFLRLYHPIDKSIDFWRRVERFTMATKLMPLRPSGCALRSLSRRRPSQHAFSTSPSTAALSP